MDENGCSGYRYCEGGRWTECIGVCEPHTPFLNDLFTLTNAPVGTAVAMVVDGQGAGGPINDSAHVGVPSGAETTFGFGALDSSTDTNEVIAFASGRAPTWHATPWTSAVDHFTGPIDDTQGIAIKIWVVQGPFEDEALDALEAAIDASALFRTERSGIALSAMTIANVTGHPNAAAALETLSYSRLVAVGYTPGRLNIYWLNTVNGGTGNGVSYDGTPVIAVGHDTEGGVFAHECGHAFVLEHVDGLPNYDGTNIMASSAWNRLYFTEGQNFRMHFHPSSQLNHSYHLRPNKPSRVCSRDTADRFCPRNDRRLWADGATFPAN